MIYQDYEHQRRRYKNAKRLYMDLIDEKSELFERTQPKAIRYDKDRITGGEVTDSNAEYLAELQRRGLNQRIAECRNLLDERETLMELTKKDLKASSNVYDRVYCCHYFEQMRIHQIALLMNYSDTQISRFRKTVTEWVVRYRAEEPEDL